MNTLGHYANGGKMILFGSSVDCEPPMNVQLRDKKPSAIPFGFETLINTFTRTEGSFPRTKFIQVFEYNNCTREFDGSHWSLTNWKRGGLFSTVTGEQISSDL